MSDAARPGAIWGGAEPEDGSRVPAPVADPAWFAEPGRENGLKLLLHLTPYSHLLMVTGGPGVGKSRLLRRLGEVCGESWRMVTVTGGPALDRPALLEALGEGIGLRPALAADLGLLRERLGALRRRALLPVLAIDDAHRLPDGGLGFLLDLTEAADGEEPLLAVILAGEPEPLDSRLRIAARELQERVAHRVELRPFNEHETRAYVHHRLAGFDPTLRAAFSASVIRFIHTSSRGLPGRVDDYVRLILEREQQRPETPVATDASRRPAGAATFLRHGFIALAIALTLVGVIYRDNLVLPGRGDAPADASPAVAETGTIRPAEPTARPSRNSAGGPSGDAATDPSGAARLSDPGASEGSPALLAGVDGVGGDGAEPGRGAPGFVDPGPADAGESADAPGGVVATTAAPLPEAGEADTQVRREAWLLGLPASSWTLQLFASREDRILALIREYGLGAEAAVYRVRDGDPPLHALVWGVFPDREAAVVARDGPLGEAGRDLGAWPRPVGEIQTAIRAADGGTEGRR